MCTGALVLGAAGLLRGYRAATHWSAMEALPLLGAEAVDERVVIDRNRITGGGVTAGIDFGLTVVSELFGERDGSAHSTGSGIQPAAAVQRRLAAYRAARRSAALSHADG